MPQRPPTKSAQADADFELTVLHPAAVHGEVVVSVGRLVILGLLVVRLWTSVGASTLQISLTLAATVIGGAMSGVAISLARRRRLPVGWIVWSPLLDVVVCSLILLADALAGDESTTLLSQPGQLALLVLATIASGLRLLPKAAILGGVASLVCAVLVLLLGVRLDDSNLNIVDVVELVVILAGCVAVTVATATRSRKLAVDAAKGARRSERAEHGLESLMKEHHDVRAVLSAAAINSSMVLRALIDSSRAPGGLKEVAQDLREDLREASRAIHRIKQQAYAELTTLTDVVQVDVRRALDRVVAATSRRFSQVEITWHPPANEVVAAVKGGADGLERMVANLLNNACEGDGTTAADRVELSVEVGATDVAIMVADNGPGFPTIALTESRAGYPTTKPEGSGLGLLMVEGLVHGSGGRLEKSNRPQGGAQVRMVLLQQPPAS